LATWTELGRFAFVEFRNVSCRPTRGFNLSVLGDDFYGADDVCVEVVEFFAGIQYSLSVSLVFHRER
jgi:hypothetical protein